jgi:HD-like signal output (HDOD) protein
MNDDNETQAQNKTGDALKAQRFQMLEDIAKELQGEVVFPTYFDAVLRLRKVLQDPNQSIGDIANAISIEPLISAKLLHLANSVAFNPQGREISEMKSAITRLGLNAVRSTAMAIVMSQLLRAKGMADYTSLTHSLWEHSIKTACAAKVIAKNHTKFNPDEAFLAGLVHDLGAFYMLYRATQYDELRSRPDSVKYLIIQWHESIGVSLLGALGMPEEIVNATVDHDQLRTCPPVVRNLSDVIYIANMLAGGHFEWLLQDQQDEPADLIELNAKFDYLMPEIEIILSEMKNCFG